MSAPDMEDPERLSLIERAISIKSNVSRKTVIVDPSSEIAGVVANEIAAENFENELDEDPAFLEYEYGAAGSRTGTSANQDISETNSTITTDDDGDGYMVPKSELIPILVALFSLVFLSALDATILSTLMTVIASELNAIQSITWIATSYLLTCSVFQPLFGKISDIFGRKPILIICIVLFSIGCFFCAVSTTVSTFVFARGLTGLAGGLNTVGTIILSDLVSLRKRGLLQGYANCFYAFGSAVGGSLGGWIAHQYGWRMAFWVQIPICVICLFLVVKFMHLPPISQHEDKTFREKLARIDFLGSLLLVLSLISFMVATSFAGKRFAFFSKEFVFLILVSGLLLSLFAYVELKIAKEPVIPVKLLADRSVLGASLSNWFGCMFVFSLVYYYPIYLSTVLRLNSAQIGTRMIPTIVTSSMASVAAGLYMKSTGRYYTFTNLYILIGFFGILILIARTFPFGLTTSPTTIEQYFMLVLSNSSFGAMITVTLLALIAAVPVAQQASTTSIQYAFRSTGSTLGVTIASTIFTTILKGNLATMVPAAAPKGTSLEEIASIITKATENAEYIFDGAPNWAYNVLRESYAIGCWYTYIFAAAASFLCLCSTLMIKEYKLHTSVNRK
ncbi:unnamed protein product [[Candida] boidinii]|uniref:Unnamed protein product n=1 Tax=Candida boidinii TaxID=5477 RepID=A0A9W6T354_CANBO|nr:hypothetical protein BVG19_g2188 [[Candida] boidinii]OWB50737.1 hypothetical protein B5S27_g2289 [[Candida] boidinii]OWB65302.1 hypothetical protein B5S30_g626 [[Candida] boidinii]OWB85895.1 hypothetical protein B5S33_g4570 [[Candida] boidinii]GME73435.1 unnamed protein product [[Candida] boidinii]